MIQLWLFLGVSFILLGGSLTISKIKDIPLSTVISLLAFGIALSIPFIMVEHLTINLKFYFVILAFIAIELIAIFSEKHVKCFHDLIHHNVKHLRIASFILIGIGFTYGEVAVSIFHYTGATKELLTLIPLKAGFGIFIHTVLTSLSSLIHMGTLLVGDILETVIRFISYYLRIAFLSASHYLYVFFSEHEFSLYILPFITLNLVFFFVVKNYLDKKGALPS